MLRTALYRIIVHCTALHCTHYNYCYCYLCNNRVYEDYPYLLAEMYAYSMAAAHDELPHLQLDNYMISSSDAGGEAWPHIDSLPQVCIPPDEDGMTMY